MRAAIWLACVCLLVAGCGGTVGGTATWPGARLDKAALGAADFPPGVRYDRIIENPGEPDGAGGPGSMLSRPQGCANALTDVIAGSAERGPGSAVKYAVSFDGARIVVTLLSSNLNLDKLRAAAERCARFEAFFDPGSEGIPITTAPLPGLSVDALAYQQTMTLRDTASSVYMAFQNVGSDAVFGLAFGTPDPSITVTATMPQTFLDVFSQQVTRLRAS